MALRAASQTCSIPPSHSVFNLFLLASFLHFNVCDSPPSVRSGKMSRTKHCGGLRMFGVFVAWPAGCIKREVEGEDEGGWGGLQTPLWQILHSEAVKQNSRLAVHILSTSPSVCHTVAALRGSHNIPESAGFQKESLSSSSRMRFSGVKSSGCLCLPSFHRLW